MLSKKIRAHKEANPKATAKEIAQAVGTSPAYVYQILAPKKPKKAKKQLKPVVPTEGQKIVRSEIERLHAELANMKILNDVNALLANELEDEVKQLENDVIGYRAVISYLQGQLDGVTV